MDSFVEYHPSDFLDLSLAAHLLHAPDLLTGPFDRRITALAAQCARLFFMRLPFAENAFFFGAQLPADRFPHLDKSYGNAAGRGCTLIDAFRSCMGETAELLAIQPNPIPETSLPGEDGSGLRDAEIEWFLDVLGISKIPISEFHGVRANSILRNSDCFVPKEAVLVCSNEARKSRRIPSNEGAGAGSSTDRAICTGLLELVERDAIALWWYGGGPARGIPESELVELGVAEFADGIARSNDRVWWIMEIQNDFDIPVCCAVSSDFSGEDIIAGFAAKPTLADAAQSALLEMSQMELASLISNARAGTVRLEDMSPMDRQWMDQKQALSVAKTPEILAPTSDRRFSTDKSGMEPYALARIIEDAGFSALYIDITPREFKIKTVKAIIPGLQSMNNTTITKRLQKLAQFNGRDPTIIPRLM